MQPKRFTNQVVLITGAASGIGRACAIRFAQEGANVACLDLNEAANQAAAAECRELGVEALALSCNVADADSVQAAVAATMSQWGRLDILVAAAGIYSGAPLPDVPLRQWQRLIDINLTGVFLCNRAAVAHMTANNYGRIVNIASIAGKEGNPNASAYSASKAAVIALTKSLGKELAKTGIRVNCVTPAAVKTGMFAQMTQAHIDFMLSKIPMGRFGEVDEIAALVTWLTTEECSFSTGAVFDLSGGRAVY
jgi:3-oxoacyl-[acyl-carrier protein] reductase